MASKRRFNEDYDLSWRIAVALAWEEHVPAATMDKEECKKFMDALQETILEVMQGSYPKDKMDDALREYDDIAQGEFETEACPTRSDG